MTRRRVSAFRWVPPFAQGVVRDLRVRWALEEAGLAYEENLIGPEDQGSAAYRALQPFGQVPAYEEDGLILFESGAIVLHVAEHCEALLPADPSVRRSPPMSPAARRVPPSARRSPTSWRRSRSTRPRASGRLKRFRSIGVPP